MDEELNLELLDGGNDGLAVHLQEIMAKSSGRYLKERNPKLWHVIAVAVSYGVPYEALANGTGVSPNTIAAIAREVKPIALEDHKKHILEGIRQARHSVLRRLNELLDSGEPIPAAALGILFGILTDKEAMESGGTTPRSQQTEDPETTAFLLMLSTMRQSQGAGMSLGQESLPANGARAAAGDSMPGQIVDMAPENAQLVIQSPAIDATTIDTTNTSL